MSRINPPVGKSVEWDSARTKALFDRACMDCHSNETVWPWYSKVAPISWVIARHVNEGRGSFNVSAFHEEGGPNAVSSIESGKMPLASYLYLHPKARLNPEERATLIKGLDETFIPGVDEQTSITQRNSKTT